MSEGDPGSKNGAAPRPPAAVADRPIAALNLSNTDLSLPRPPGAIRTFFRENPRWMDVILVFIFLAATAGMAFLSVFVPADVTESQPLEPTTPEYLQFPQALLMVLVLIVTVAALLLRRRFPLPSLLAAVAVSAFIPSDFAIAGATPIAIAVLLYSVPVYQSVRAGWVGYAVTVIAALAPIPFMGNVFTGEISVDGETPAADFDEVIQGAVDFRTVLLVGIMSSLVLLLPVIIGINAGNRRRYTEAIIDRAKQLARERDQLAQLAVAEERTRIAREMHDIVAHSVSVMITLSEGAAHVVDDAPDDAKQAIRQSAETGRSALAEMRRLIGVLRAGDTTETSADLAPTPGLGEIPELVHGFRSAGLTIQLRLDGTSVKTETDGDRSRELAVYRTIQEALTNTLRHAGQSANATVVVTQDANGTLVQIEDDGGVAGGRRPMSGEGTGHGLVGLSERLRVFRGTLEHGPTEAGGWRVKAYLPGGWNLDD
ncbi:histidine kinase [Actinomycetaceae bacterium MB13-C1-2]|nr:histidine kinase [Actinomycetaceae bacterium MB13-C1-2]